MTIVENHLLTVTGGIDTHLDFHVAAAIDSNGGVLGVETFETTTGGYRRLVAWLAGFGTISLVGVDGTTRRPRALLPVRNRRGRCVPCRDAVAREGAERTTRPLPRGE